MRYKKIRGWRSFTSVPVNDVAVTVEVGDVSKRVTADRGGVVDVVLPATISPGWHTITIRTDESEVIEAPVFIVDPAVRFGIISDIDDTVMVTALASAAARRLEHLRARRARAPPGAGDGRAARAARP